MEPKAKHLKDLKCSQMPLRTYLVKRNHKIDGQWPSNAKSKGLPSPCVDAVSVWGLQEGVLSAGKSEDPPAQPHGGETLPVSAPGLSQGLQQLQWQSQTPANTPGDGEWMRAATIKALSSPCLSLVPLKFSCLSVCTEAVYVPGARLCKTIHWSQLLKEAREIPHN